MSDSEENESEKHEPPTEPKVWPSERTTRVAIVIGAMAGVAAVVVPLLVK